MRSRCTPVVPWLISALLAGASSALAGELESLLAKSPFSTAPAAVAPAADEAANLELRSVLQEDGEYVFSIFDSTTHRSYWVRRSDNDARLTIRDYDARRELLLVELNGRTVRMALNQARRQAAGPAPTPAVAANLPQHSPFSAPTPNQPPSIAPSPPETLSPQQVQLAAEIQMRRAARRAARGADRGTRLPRGGARRSAQSRHRSLRAARCAVVRAGFGS